MFRRLNYFTRLFIFCLLLGALPVIVTGVFSYGKASTLIQDKVNEGNLQILLQTQSRVEQELKTVDHMAVQFLNSPLIAGLLKQDLTPRDYKEVQDVLKNMYLMQTFEFGIFDIYLVNTDFNWVVHKDGLYRLSEHRARQELLDYASLDVSSAWIRGREHITLVKKWPPHAARPNGLFVLHIPRYDLNQMVASSPKLGDFMVIDRQNRVIAESRPDSDELRPSRIALQMQRIRRDDEAQGYFAIDTGQREEEVAFRKSDYNGWVYISATDRRELTREAESIGWVTLWVCLLLIGLTLAVSWLGSRKMYSPVRRLVDVVKTAGQAPVPRSFADEFHFVAEGIQSLLKTQSELRGEMDVQLRQWEMLFMIRLLRGELRPKEIEEHWRRFSYPAGERKYVILALQIDTLDHTRYREQDKDLLLYAISNVAGELIPRERRLAPLVIDHVQATVVCSRQPTGEEIKQEAFREAERLRDTVRAVLGLTVSIGISRARGAAPDIAAAYVEAIEALKYRFRLGEDIIVHIEDTDAGPGMKAAFPSRTADDLYDAVRAGDAERAAVQLREALEQLTQAGLTPQEFQMMLVRLLIDLLRLAPDRGGTGPGERSERSLVEQLTQLQLVPDIERWFLQTVIEPLMQYLESKREFQYEKISGEIVELIHRRFDTDLSLEICAAELNYHPSYVKRVFRKGTGTSFSEYLVHYRMKMAKQWLAETDMRITEISERLRYNNVQNFIRQFRKLEGVTPGQYRKAGGGAGLPPET